MCRSTARIRRNREEECLERAGAAIGRSGAHPPDQRCAAGSAAERRSGFLDHRRADGAGQFGPVKTFSIGFRAEQFNEAEYARLVARAFGTEHHELIARSEYWKRRSTYLSRMMEEPFGDSSMLPTYYVCRMARQHVTVALSGDGGDELFAGYDRYIVAMERQQVRSPADWLGRIYRESSSRLVPGGMYGKNLAWNASLNDARSLPRRNVRSFPRCIASGACSPTNFCKRAAVCRIRWRSGSDTTMTLRPMIR